MKIKIKQLQETELDIKCPSYYKEYGTFTRITEKGIYQVNKQSIFFTPSDYERFGENVLSVIKHGEECSDMEFLDAWDKTISKLSELLVL